MNYDWYGDELFASLKGQTLQGISGNIGSEEMRFITDDGTIYRMFHSQDCCESVNIEDIVGDLQDLIGEPILQAEVVTHSGSDSERDPEHPPLYDYVESYTWTYYKLATIKGSVTIRWYGASNGYYSEHVTLAREGEY